jgi:hypothetical protein
VHDWRSSIAAAGLSTPPKLGWERLDKGDYDMGANIWFWLIYVLIGFFGLWGMNPWRPTQPWGPFGSWVILFVLVGILGISVYGSPIR